MTRAWRIRLTVMVVVLGIPLCLAGLLVWFVSSGRIEHRIAAEWRAQFPGDLRIGSIQVTGGSELTLRQVSLGEGTGRPLVVAAKVVVGIDLLGGRLHRVQVEGLQGWLDGNTFDLLDRLTSAAGRMKPSDPPQDFDLLVTGGSTDFPRGPPIREMRVEGRVIGPVFDLACQGTIGDRPVRVRVIGRAPTPSTRRLTVEVQEAILDSRPAVDALESIRLLPQVGEATRTWLPERVDAAGTTVRCDTVDASRGLESPATYGADLRLAWAGGGLSGELSADQRRLGIVRLRFADPDLGLAEEGVFSIGLQRGEIALQAPSWRPGRRLPIPVEVPTERILQVLPGLALNAEVGGSTHPLVIELTPRDTKTRARLALAWSPGSPLRLTGRELPLTLAQAWLPPGLVASGGLIDETRVVLDGTRLQDLSARVGQAGLVLGGWSFGPVDGELALRPSGPLDSAPFTASLTMPMAKGTWQGTLGAGRLQLEIASIEGLLTRLRGQARLPDVRGAMACDIEGELPAAGGLSARFTRLALQGVGIPDLVRELDANLRGDLAWGTQGLRLKVGGHLTRGGLRLPGVWLDLARRSPIFTVALASSAGGEGGPGALLIEELLVRAADAKGEPAANGYSAQFMGRIDSAGGGRLRGLIDHADLGWVSRLAQKEGAALEGEGAIVCDATLAAGAVTGLEGYFLPLNADLRLGKDFNAQGITGAVRFRLDRSSEEAP